MAGANGESKEKPLFQIDIVSDFMCPWCWVGKRKLDLALRELDSQFTFRVRWEPFLLKPDFPMEGMLFEQMGFSPEKRKLMQQRLQEEAKSIGLNFATDRKFVSNTIMAHLLTEYAEEHGGIDKQNDVVDRLLTAIFGDGLNLDREFLLKVASDVGLDAGGVDSFITSPERQESLKMKAKSWSEKGVHGVPFFYMNGQATFSGAQEPDVFKTTILKIADMAPLQTEDKKAANL